MKSISTFLLAFVLFGCADKQEQNIKQMETSVRNYFNDFAFKENSKLEILELKSYGYTTVTENSIDSIRLLAINEKRSHFEDMMRNQLEIQKSKSQQLKLAISIGNNTLTDIYNEDIQSAFTQLKIYKDSVDKYIQKDSIIRNGIENRKAPNEVYKAKFFIKATALKNGKSDNMLDTLNFYFDKGFKLIIPNSIY